MTGHFHGVDRNDLAFHRKSRQFGTSQPLLGYCLISVAVCENDFATNSYFTMKRSVVGKLPRLVCRDDCSLQRLW